MYKKGDIVKSTLNNHRFYVYCNQIDNLEVTLIDYNDPDYMTSSYVCFLVPDVEFTRILKIKKIINEIRTKRM